MRSLSAAICAAAIFSLAVPARSARTAPIHLEAENARLTGLSVMTEIPGYSGSGYVGRFEHDGDRLVFTVSGARAGIYDVRIRYSSPDSDKGYGLVVNGSRFGSVPDIGKMRRFGAFWSYFVSWTGDLGPRKVSQERLKQLYGGADVVNREQLPPNISP